MSKSRGSVIPGIILIIIGVWFLSRHFYPVEIVWVNTYPIVFILFAIFLIFNGLRRPNTSNMFWGVFFLCIGAFFTLRNFGIIPFFYTDEYWPIFLVALGISFISMFIVRPSDWGVLIPGSILLFFGVGFSMRTFNGFFWGWGEFMGIYWPVILIVIGAGILISSLHNKPRE